MKKINQQINKLWQSNTNKVGQKGLLWMALLFLIIAIFFLIILQFTDKDIEQILFTYMMGVHFLLSITFFATYGYVYNRVRISKKLESFIKFLYKFILLICFIASIPMYLLIKIMELIFIRKAKRMENFETWLFIVVIDLTTVLLFMHINIFISTTASSIISSIVNYKVSEYSIFLLTYLLLIKGEWELINLFLLKIINHYGMSKIKKSVLNSNSIIPTELPNEINIKEYVEDKKQKLEEIEKNEIKELNYDLAYQKISLWKFQLLCLIFLFLIATFIPDFMFHNQSDAVNVITVITLIMLYSDKRKIWDKEFLDL